MSFTCSLQAFTIGEIETVQGANLATHPKVSEKDIIGKVSIMVHVLSPYISFLHQDTLNFRLMVRRTLSLNF